MQHSLALKQALPIAFAYYLLSSFVEEMDCFKKTCFLADFQLNFMSENHSMDFAILLPGEHIYMKFRFN